MERFVGTWKLVSWTSGSETPFGAQPQGTLVYTAGGTMISAFMRRDRAPIGKDLAAWRWRRLASADMDRRFVEAALAFNSYSGRYTVEGSQVHHDVEIAMFPDWIGQRLTRRFRFEGQSLSLSFASDELVWRKE
jgi:hypothetical protein